MPPAPVLSTSRVGEGVDLRDGCGGTLVVALTLGVDIDATSSTSRDGWTRVHLNLENVDEATTVVLGLGADVIVDNPAALRIKQLDAGVLAHHMVGTHRRLRLADVLAYRDQIDRHAEAALAAMTVEAEDLGLYNQ